MRKRRHVPAGKGTKVADFVLLYMEELNKIELEKQKKLDEEKAKLAETEEHSAQISKRAKSIAPTQSTGGFLNSEMLIAPTSP